METAKTSSAVFPGLPFQFSSIGIKLGENRIDVGTLFPNSDRLISRTGVPTVYQTAGSALDLAADAATIALGKHEMHRFSRDDIGALLYVSQSPTSFLPSDACRLQNLLDIPTSVMALDLGQGCSGFVQALILAVHLLRNSSHVLIVNSDTYRSKLDRLDRSTSSLFSDAASAVILSTRNPTHTILSEMHVTDGSGAEDLMQPVASPSLLHMDGPRVLEFTRSVVPDQIRRLLASAGLGAADIDTFLFHQASRVVLDSLKDSLELAPSQMPTILDKTGNLVSASIPALLDSVQPSSLRGTTVMSGFGVGLSSSAVLLAPHPRIEPNGP